jgi:hypothetical protein
MDATVDRPMTAPISTINTVLIPFVALHLRLPDKTKIYALLFGVRYLNVRDDSRKTTVNFRRLSFLSNFTDMSS